jgi:outer membrane protein assembly factor BamD
MIVVDRWGRVRRLSIAALVACTGCAPGFRVDKLAEEPEKLFLAGKQELTKKKWTNAVAAFEKLTTDLPARDTLLPLSFWYLAQARTGNAEHLLSAQAYTRIAETWPEDSLADDALFESAKSYRRLWRSPELDATYGQTAQATFQTLLSLYPDTKRKPDAERELASLDEQFAAKEYQTGYYYFRRKAYDPAIIYFKSVVAQHPNAPKAKDAWLRLIESYRAIRYREEADEACAAVRVRHSQDPDVVAHCPATATVKDTTAARPPAPSR